MPTIRVKAIGSTVAMWGEPDPDWHALAQETYRSLASSQQASLAQPSDVAVARFACLSMTRILLMTKFSALGFKSVCESLNDLGATLGARLRLRIELESAEATGAEATATRLRAMFAGDGGEHQARILRMHLDGEANDASAI
jgi:hypothetical protein